MFRRHETHKNAIALAGHKDLTDRYFEVARFWVSSERSYVLVSPDVVTDPTLLGSLLVECVHTAAAGYASIGEMSEEAALAALWRGFDEERARLGAPSSAKGIN